MEVKTIFFITLLMASAAANSDADAEIIDDLDFYMNMNMLEEELIDYVEEEKVERKQTLNRKER